jgi:hypothetical protein
MAGGARQELVERIDGVVRELAVGVARGGCSATAVVLDGDAPLGQPLAERLERLAVEAEILRKALDLGLAQAAEPLGALDPCEVPGCPSASS